MSVVEDLPYFGAQMAEYPFKDVSNVRVLLLFIKIPLPNLSGDSENAPTS